MGWLGDHEPSELLKNSLQFGSAIAADVPASVAATQTITSAATEQVRVATSRFMIASPLRRPTDVTVAL
jgi:hypothetical protein